MAVFALTAIVTRRTALGMLIEAVGINPEASRLAGVRSRTIIWTVYVFAALCAGVAGLMIAGNTSAADANNAGLWIELDAILAVVIGGTSLAGGRFSLAGTLVGALVIQTLATTIPTIGIPPQTNYLFKADRRDRRVPAPVAEGPRRRCAVRRRGRRPPRPRRQARHEHRHRPDHVTWDRVRALVAAVAVPAGAGDPGAVRRACSPPAASATRGSPRPQVVLNLFFDNAFLIVLAVGMTFVILTGGIDLSVGSVVALSTMVAARTLEAGWPAELSMILVLVVGTGLGLLMGLVIHYFDIQPFIATLAGMFLARGLCYLISIESIPIRNHTFYDLGSAQIPLPGGLSPRPRRSPPW